MLHRQSLCDELAMYIFGLGLMMSLGRHTSHNATCLPQDALGSPALLCTAFPTGKPIGWTLTGND